MTRRVSEEFRVKNMGDVLPRSRVLKLRYFIDVQEIGIA